MKRVLPAVVTACIAIGAAGSAAGDAHLQPVATAAGEPSPAASQIVSQKHSGQPFVPREAAEQVALRVGAGPGTVVLTQRGRLRDPSTAPPFWSSAGYVGNDRDAWFIQVHGPYRPFFWLPRSQPPIFDHYYVVVDATTGQVLGTGAPLHQYW